MVAMMISPFQCRATPVAASMAIVRSVRRAAAVRPRRRRPGPGASAQDRSGASFLLREEAEGRGRKSRRPVAGPQDGPTRSSRKRSAQGGPDHGRVELFRHRRLQPGTAFVGSSVPAPSALVPPQVKGCQGAPCGLRRRPLYCAVRNADRDETRPPAKPADDRAAARRWCADRSCRGTWTRRSPRFRRDGW